MAEVRIEHSTDGYITHVKVYSENGATIIKGATRCQEKTCHGSPTHVDVVVINSDGQIVDELEITAQVRPHRHAPAWFRAELPYEMKPGMVVVMQFHDDARGSQDREQATPTGRTPPSP